MEFTGPVIFWTAFVTMMVSQLLKMIIISIKTGKISPEAVFELAGMPSSHTASVTSAVLGVYLSEGFSALFAIMFLFLIYVITEVYFLELSTSRHAKIINEVVPFIKTIGHKPQRHGHLFERQIREEWGHTPIEIASGFLLGLILTIIIYML